MDINVILFDRFTALDFVGPVEALQRIEGHDIKYYSLEGGPITNGKGFVVDTLPFTKLKKGIMLIPGGWGTRTLVNDEVFILNLKKIAEDSVYVLSVCTGSVLLAKSGVLDGKVATSNKNAMDWAKHISASVKWMEKARWTIDGNIYTSSGVSAGIDMALGFISDKYGREEALQTAKGMEYIWNENPKIDPFAK